MLHRLQAGPSIAEHLRIYASAQTLPLARERCWPAPAAVPGFLLATSSDPGGSSGVAVAGAGQQ
jgi:hypothetical protein